MRWVLLLLLTWGCLTLEVATAPASLPDVQAQVKLSGLWRTEGYGYLIQLVGDSLKAFEATDPSCIQGFGAHQIAQDASHVVFQHEDYH